MNIDIELPASLTARFEGWHPDTDGGTSVVIYFGTAEVAVIPTPQFDSAIGKPVTWPSDDTVSKVAAEWLRARLGVTA